MNFDICQNNIISLNSGRKVCFEKKFKRNPDSFFDYQAKKPERFLFVG